MAAYSMLAKELATGALRLEDNGNLVRPASTSYHVCRAHELVGCLATAYTLGCFEVELQDQPLMGMYNELGDNQLYDDIFFEAFYDGLHDYSILKETLA
jgi:hypothetical protein